MAGAHGEIRQEEALGVSQPVRVEAVEFVLSVKSSAPDRPILNVLDVGKVNLLVKIGDVST